MKVPYLPARVAPWLYQGVWLTLEKAHDLACRNVAFDVAADRAMWQAAYFWTTPNLARIATLPVSLTFTYRARPPAPMRR